MLDLCLVPHAAFWCSGAFRFESKGGAVGRETLISP